MKPELFAYVLTLPADVRRELLKAGGPGWIAHPKWGYELKEEVRHGDPLEEFELETGTRHVLAYLPVSPKDIAKHAAKLAGAVGHTIETFADRTTASVRFRVSDVVPGGKLTISDYADGDETGHRAAIGLLRKVMDR